jgi:hypothetical protein
VIPASLLRDLRREAEKARELAHAEGGPDAQRLQPVYAYSELNHQVFRDFRSLPVLWEAVEMCLGTERRDSNVMAILFQPSRDPWTTGWHRDLPPLGTTEEQDLNVIFDLKRYNQFNAALYDDHSFWVVPGSHVRDDTEEERRICKAGPPDKDAPVSSEEKELACMRHVRSMPGGVNIVLAAGDLAFYRAVAWHLGTYVPYVRRATLHDGFLTAEDLAIGDHARAMDEKARAAMSAR